MGELGAKSPREELAALEAEEERVSAERRRLHQQIDNGFATEMTRARERDVSLRRRELHRRISQAQRARGAALAFAAGMPLT